MTCSSNAQVASTLSISAQGSPSPGNFDLWLVRKHGGSWEEVGSTSLGSTTRDFVMSDTGAGTGLAPICP